MNSPLAQRAWEVERKNLYADLIRFYRTHIEPEIWHHTAPLAGAVAVEQMRKERPDLFEAFAEAWNFYDQAALAAGKPSRSWGAPYAWTSWRSVARAWWGFSCPTSGALAKIAAYDEVVEVGAGTGWWAYLLQEMGVTVHATDDYSWTMFTKRWTKVQKRKAGIASRRHPEAALLMVWPPYDEPMGYQAVRAYRGATVIYVQEDCTGCDRLRALLDAEWHEVDSAPVWNFPGVRDRLVIYERGPAPREEE